MAQNKVYLGLTFGSLVGAMYFYNTHAFLSLCFLVLFLFCFYTNFRF